MAPNCEKMACTGEQADHYFCATHRGEISSFEAQSRTIADPCHFPSLFADEVLETNYAAAIKKGAIIAGVTAATLPFAGPIVGGVARVIGGMSGLVGAAATSHGLAILGGGSLASGGFGMAGGAAVGTGALATAAAVRSQAIARNFLDDIGPDFRIIKIRDGADPALLCINGFTSEERDASRTEVQNKRWLDGLGRKFEDRAVYRVLWPSKTLMDWLPEFEKFEAGQLAGASAGEIASNVGKFALSAAKAAGSVALGAASAVTAVDNPWSIALTNSRKTGFLLADIISRCEGRSFTLIGHSLGARVCVFTLRRLAKRASAKPKSSVIDVHLLGGAVDSGDPKFWAPVCQAIKGRCYNYYSRNDKILPSLFRIGTLSPFGAPIGLSPIATDANSQRTLLSKDVSTVVDGHERYHDRLHQILESADALPSLPADEAGCTIAVMHVMTAAQRALSAAEIALSFAAGTDVERRVALALLDLAQRGRLASHDGGETFVLRLIAMPYFSR